MPAPQPWYCRAMLGWVFALASACGTAQGMFVVTEPWVRPGAANQSAEAYMQLTSSTGATLTGARTRLARSVALRSPAGKSIAPMALTLPPTEVVTLQAKGYRLVLQALTRRLREGDRVPLVLAVRNVDGTVAEIEVDAEVRLHSPTDDHRGPHPHR